MRERERERDLRVVRCLVRLRRLSSVTLVETKLVDSSSVKLERELNEEKDILQPRGLQNVAE